SRQTAIWPRLRPLVDLRCQPSDRVLGAGKGHAVLQNIIEIDAPVAVMVEDRDRSSAIFIRPKLLAIEPKRCVHCRAHDACWSRPLKLASSSTVPPTGKASVCRADITKP